MTSTEWLNVDQVRCNTNIYEKNPYKDSNFCKEEYNWKLPPQNKYVYSALTVQVNKIKEAISYLACKNVEILYIHDF